MERYEAYKYSGVEWIGEIPQEWNLKRIKYLSISESSLFIDGDWIESKDIVFDKSQIRYITTGNVGEGRYKEQGRTYITNEKFIELNCTEIFPDDLIISRLNPPIGRCCIVPDIGSRIVTSVDNVVLRPDKKYRKEFLKYAMCSSKYFEYTSLIARGATMQRISRSLLGNVALPIPINEEEQIAIANFLDLKTGEIDALIAQKERLLELYEEEKTAIINHAVTKGLDPKAELKISGVEWLGKIPVKWKTTSLKWKSRIYSGGTPSKNRSEYWFNGGIPWLNSGAVNQMVITEQSDFITEEGFRNSSAKWIEKESIVVALAGQGKTKGMAAIVALRTTCNQSLAAIQPASEINSWYLLYYLRANYLNIRGLAGESRRDGLNLEMIGSITIPLFSRMEQTAIVKHIETETTRIDAKITKTQRIIELQKEYRNVLIFEVVTGKTKVLCLAGEEAVQ